MITLQHVLLICSIAAFTLAAIAVNVLRNQKTFNEGQKDPKSESWHAWQGVTFGAFFFNCARENWHIALPGWLAFWILFDGFNNLLTFKNRGFLFVGSTAWTDRQFQKTGNPVLWMTIAKSVLFVAACYVAIKY